MKVLVYRTLRGTGRTEKLLSRGGLKPQVGGTTAAVRGASDWWTRPVVALMQRVSRRASTATPVFSATVVLVVDATTTKAR